jgi:hypothetical protein
MTTKTDYTALDVRIIECISAGMTNAAAIELSLKDDLKAHRTRDRYGVLGSEYRVLDRRLQALRKAVKIVYAHKGGWSVVEAA